MQRKCASLWAQLPRESGKPHVRLFNSQAHHFPKTNDAVQEGCPTSAYFQQLYVCGLRGPRCRATFMWPSLSAVAAIS